jgi:hypothetical protein
MRPRAAFWSTTTFVVRGSFLPFAISDSRRSTRKMMSMARALLQGRLATDGMRAGNALMMPRARAPYRRSRARRSGSMADAGSIVDTSPPKLAISLTRLELT